MRVLLTLGLLLLTLSSQAEVQFIENTELIKRTKANEANLIIIDIRDPEEFTGGHIEGAINIPHTQIIDDASVLAPYYDKQIVLHCRSGSRTGRTLDYIDSNKFKMVYHLKGDMIGWKQAKLPLIYKN